MNLEEMKERLVHWMGEMKHGYRDPSMYMAVEKNRIRILLYTSKNCYQIVAVPREDGKDYLGAQASSRTPRAGEDWTRGNDLADGTFCEETWRKIVADIVGYELVKIHRSINELEVTTYIYPIRPTGVKKES